MEKWGLFGRIPSYGLTPFLLDQFLSVMAREEELYKEGLERGREGKWVSMGMANELLSNEAEKAAARRGYEAGQSARAHAEEVEQALEEALEAARDESDSSDYSYSGSYHPTSSTSSTTSSSGSSPVLLYVYGVGVVICVILGFIIGAVSGWNAAGGWTAEELLLYSSLRILGAIIGFIAGLIWPLALIVLLFGELLLLFNGK